jgi:DNA-binding MarR family transcriptional regulator
MSSSESGPRRRLPIRVRLTLTFAGVLAAVLGAAGVVLSTELERDLDNTINAELARRTADVLALLEDERDPDAALATGGEPLAQVFDRSGRLLASTLRLERTRLLSASEVRRAMRDTLEVDRRETPAGAARVRAEVAHIRAARPVVVAVGNSLANRDAALDRLQTLLLLREPFRAGTKLLHRRFAERGHPEIRPPHGNVMQFLDDGGTRVSVLAGRAEMTKQSMAELVSHLERLGYVERVPEPSDRRAKLVRATPRGKQTFERRPGHPRLHVAGAAWRRCTDRASLKRPGSRS